MTPNDSRLRAQDSRIPPGPGEKRILAAYAAARTAQADYALKALICGQLMLEQRAVMLNLCKPCTGSPNEWYQPNKADKFGVWLESHDICRRTAYRWMEAADRVCRAQLGIAVGADLPTTIEVEGTVVSLSQALTVPEKELTGASLKFRQDVFGFMADRTLTDALNAAIDGESPAHRITRAHSGKMLGGAGRGEAADRKHFEQFTALKLRHITTFLRAKLTQSQRALILASFHKTLELWPRWLLEAIAEKCKAETKLSDAERAARTEF